MDMDIITKEVHLPSLDLFQAQIPCNSTNQTTHPKRNRGSSNSSPNPSVPIIQISCIMYRSKPNPSTMLSNFKHGSPQPCKCCPTSLHHIFLANQRIPPKLRLQCYSIISKCPLAPRPSINKTLPIAPPCSKATQITWVI